MGDHSSVEGQEGLETSAPKSLLEFQKVGTDYKKPENFLIKDSVSGSLKTLDKIYEDIRFQTKASFIFSLTVICAGLVVLTIAFYTAIQGFAAFSIITIICASLIEFIGATALVIHSRLILQQQHFGEKIVKTQDSAFANDICKEIDDQKIRDHIRGMLVIETVTRKGAMEFNMPIQSFQSSNSREDNKD